MVTPLRQVMDRVDRARADSDVALFYELLNAGEMVLKLAAAGLVACLEDDRDRHRYRLEYNLVRANGLGDWAAAVDDVLTGPASEVLSERATPEHRELSQTFPRRGSEWQSRAVRRLYEARKAIDPDTERLPRSVAARRWFADFAALRNRTRGHGATTTEACKAACQPLYESISTIVSDFHLFHRPWAHLRQNLSGKYRVSILSSDGSDFDRYKREPSEVWPTGVYLWLDGPRQVRLVVVDEELADFYLPNGKFTGRHYELLSYATDSRLSSPTDGYAAPPTALPASETEGLGDLVLVGSSFSNIPKGTDEYVQRKELESELAHVIRDDRHPVVTLLGRGGIGKTSLALQVLHHLAHEGRFLSIVWFSARDIELLPSGPKLVRPRVLTPEDIANEYLQLLQPSGRDARDFDRLGHMADALGDPNADSATLFVFDNFETLRSPLDLYRWLDTYVRLPNKVLITTRRRDFKADYWVEVGGMTESEFGELVDRSARDLEIMDLIDDTYKAELYHECDGHPYVGKVMLGEIARAGKRRRVARIMASQERMLEALFERTYSQLTPVAQRLFLTLSTWRSIVPLVAVEAAMGRPENEKMDIQDALHELRRSSLVDLREEKEGEVFISVPLSAALFAQRKATTSAMKAAIDADVEFLKLFGPVHASGTRHGVQAPVTRLFRNVAARVQTRPEEMARYRPVLEYVAGEHQLGWVLLAQLLEEQRLSDDWAEQAADAYRRYLEAEPGDVQVWRKLADACTAHGDYAGAVQALAQRAALPDAAFADISYAAMKVNGYLKDHAMAVDTDEKRALVGALADVMEHRIGEGSATDHSRLAWLLMNGGDVQRARKVVDSGLVLEPDNPHCQRLHERLARTS